MSDCLACGFYNPDIDELELKAKIAELESETRAWKQAQDDWFQETKRRAVEYNKLEKALQSIANNTCCDRCQEAALVAKAALEGKKP